MRWSSDEGGELIERKDAVRGALGGGVELSGCDRLAIDLPLGQLEDGLANSNQVQSPALVK